MSVLIRGMEIPDNCTRCDYIGLNTAVGCPIMTGTDGRATDCPLVEVKSPHGRLIDADAVIEGLAKAIPYIIDDAITNAYVEGLGRAKIEIDDSQTVIEAEDEE